MSEDVTGIEMKRVLTTGHTPVYNTSNWDIRDVAISGEDGKNVFEQKSIRVPEDWSQLAAQIVASKYFAGRLDTPEREDNIETMINRVAGTIAGLGTTEGYFRTSKDEEIFRDELTYIILHQMATFNSPVWFNIGVEGRRQQASACFILNVEDDMESILKWYTEEGRIFKGGSGSGVNLSKIRASCEPLSGGGYASGPISFMRGADSIAGGIKSGGTTRRAAKMVILDVDHPDIEEFIQCKAVEEQKAFALGREGYDMDLNGEAWTSIQFQNANNSVRVTRDFLEKAEKNETWVLKARNSQTEILVDAKDILYMMAEAAWSCGDPGIQYDTNINEWHTTPNSGRINASNPCSEYMHLDNSACNLASINLLKFLKDDIFNANTFKHVVDVMILAQDILVGSSEYPTPEIERVTKANRQLGLGYANLGALLMSMGHAYDSDSGREVAASITSLMCGRAYLQSALIAQKMGAFKDYKKNKNHMLKIIGKHRDATNISPHDMHMIVDDAIDSWNDALAIGKLYGFRNAQVTVLAPTGTIAFMMDCDTTGIEPDLSLVKYKKLVGGGTVKIVNKSVPRALATLGYEEEQIEEITEYIDQKGTIENAPHLKLNHYKIFDCALRPEKGKRFIHHMGHVKMMATTQPFLSGAISKTINMPEDVTIQDIEEVYLKGGKLGLKALAIYRDGSKKVQPLNTKKDETPKVIEKIVEVPIPRRQRLKDTRNAKTHKFDIAGHEGYLTVGMYEDGRPGELFIHMSKEGSTISGLMDAFATSVSVALQYGVPLSHLVRKFSHMRFEPSGFTGNKHVPIAKSPIDYIFRWLEKNYLSEETEELSETQETFLGNNIHEAIETIKKWNKNESFDDSPPCQYCGSIMKRSGNCYTCIECGSTSGCS